MAYASTSNDLSLGTLTGSQYDTADGRSFALIQNGGTALVSGVLVQGPVAIGANHTGLTASTQAVGDTQLTVTLGGTAVTANQYAGGFVVISAGTGIGQTLQILSHPAQATTSGTVVLTLADAIKVATLTSDSKATLKLPAYGSANGVDVRTSGCVVCPVTLTGPVIGATTSPIPASTATVPSYGFIQTRGTVAVLNDANTAIGLDVMPSANVAGAVQTYVVATKCRVGTSTVAGVDTKSLPITLQL
jgi:hypothetical protein